MYSLRTVPGSLVRAAKDAARLHGENLDALLLDVITHYAAGRRICQRDYNILSDSNVCTTCGAHSTLESDAPRIT